MAAAWHVEPWRARAPGARMQRDTPGCATNPRGARPPERAKVPHNHNARVGARSRDLSIGPISIHAKGGGTARGRGHLSPPCISRCPPRNRPTQPLLSPWHHRTLYLLLLLLGRSRFTANRIYGLIMFCLAYETKFLSVVLGSERECW